MHLFQSVNSHFEGDSIDAKRQAFIYLMAAKHHTTLTSCNWHMALKYCRGSLPVAKEMTAIGELAIDWPSASLLVWLGLCCAEKVRLKDEHAADSTLPRTLPLDFLWIVGNFAQKICASACLHVHVGPKICAKTVPNWHKRGKMERDVKKNINYWWNRAGHFPHFLLT